jgi:hypothetical protein
MPTLRSQLDALAANFATQIVAAIQGASLQELLVSGGSGQGTGGRRARAVAGGGGQPDPLSVPVPGKKPGKNGRLPRRSAQEIHAALGKIVLLVKTHKQGMRAEEIRAALGMQAKEMPRILKEGVAKKRLSTKGQKRATTYFAQ